MEENNQAEYSVKGYFLFWIGQRFSLIGTLIVGFAVTWWVTEVTESAIYLAFGSFLFLIFMAGLPSIAGVMGDKYNRKIIIALADSFNALITFIVIILFYLRLNDPLLIVIIINLRGIGQAFHQPMVAAVIPSMIPKDKLSRINGVNYLSSSMLQVVGPVIGAALLAFFPIELILWADIITYGIAMVPLVIVHIPKVVIPSHREVKKKSSFFKEFVIGLKTVRVIPGLLVIFLLSMLLNALFQPVSILSPLFIYVDHKGTAADLAFIMALANGGMILGGLITTLKKNWNHKMTTYFGGLTIAMLSILGYALAPFRWFLWIAISATLSTLVLPIVNTIYVTVIQTTVPQDKMGRVSSFDHTISYAVMPVGAILSGPLGVLLGIRILFLIISVIGVVSVLLVWQLSGIKKIDYEDHEYFERLHKKIESINSKIMI
jgi:DHA3 family macrolide efflux protein-like MFS transporter